MSGWGCAADSCQAAAGIRSHQGPSLQGVALAGQRLFDKPYQSALPHSPFGGGAKVADLGTFITTAKVVPPSSSRSLSWNFGFSDPVDLPRIHFLPESWPGFNSKE